MGAVVSHGAATFEQARSAWASDLIAPALLAVAGVLYASSLLRHPLLARRRARVAAGVAAYLLAVVALVSPLHELGHGMVSFHMTQHMLIMFAVAPLAVLARPHLAAGLGPRARRWLRSAGHPALVRAGRRLVSWPTAAAVTFVGVVFAWHVPAAYDAAVANHAVHHLEHASFLAAALWFWAALATSVRGGRYGAAVVMIVVVAFSKTALGAIMSFSAEAWYATAATTAAWGFDPLTDQQTAGLIMWMPGKSVLVIALVVVVAAVLARQPELEPAR